MPEPLLTTDDLAQRVRQTPAALRQRRYRGDSMPPAVRIGRRLLYRPADVEAWIDAHTERDETPDLSEVSLEVDSAGQDGRTAHG